MNNHSKTEGSAPSPQHSDQGGGGEPDPLWTIEDVARFMKCSQRHVGNLQRAGLPFIKLGHLTRFEPRTLKQWMGLKQKL